jgi:hypothetical protein
MSNAAEGIRWLSDAGGDGLDCKIDGAERLRRRVFGRSFRYGSVTSTNVFGFNRTKAVSTAGTNESKSSNRLLFASITTTAIGSFDRFCSRLMFLSTVNSKSN